MDNKTFEIKDPITGRTTTIDREALICELLQEIDDGVSVDELVREMRRDGYTERQMVNIMKEVRFLVRANMDADAPPSDSFFLV